VAGTDFVTKTKVCTSCRERKLFDDFYKDARNRDGRQSRCKPCFLMAQHDVSDEIKNRRRVYGRQYTADHKKESRARAVAAQRWKLPEEKERVKQWVEDNYERWKQGRRDYYQAHREEIRAQFVNRSPEKRAEAVARAAAWCLANPERARVNNHNRGVRRRIRETTQGLGLSTSLVPLLMTEQNCRCPYCLCDLRENGFHLDHYMPLALGGRHEDDNMQLTCPTCNISKADRDPMKFLLRILAPLFSPITT